MEFLYSYCCSWMNSAVRGITAQYGESRSCNGLSFCVCLYGVFVKYYAQRNEQAHSTIFLRQKGETGDYGRSKS